jgi:DMSO/TMAO reductase YedYZ molybdopterin-dependent catalytic subunit
VTDDVDTIDARPDARRRVPPGQSVTRKWPVLHYGDVPTIDLDRWRFEVEGLVEHPMSLSYAEVTSLPQRSTVCDIHCVTRWTRLDNRFTGVPVATILRQAGPRSEATHVLVRAAQGFTTNLPLADLDRPENLLAWRHDGEPLTPEHGWPLRLVIPHLYFWKSAKWVRGLELLSADEAGFWERNGYHMRGDPWREQRYASDDVTQQAVNSFRNASKQ